MEKAEQHAGPARRLLVTMMTNDDGRGDRNLHSGVSIVVNSAGRRSDGGRVTQRFEEK